MAPQAQAVVVRFDIALTGAGVARNVSGSFRLNGSYTKGWDAGERFSGGSVYHGLAFAHDLYGYTASAISGFAPITIGGATFGAEDISDHPLGAEEIPGIEVWFDREPVAGSAPLMWMAFRKTVGGRAQYLLLGDTTPCGPEALCLTSRISASDGTTGFGGDVRATVVPVPASVALLGAALAGLGLAARRRNDAG